LANCSGVRFDEGMRRMSGIVVVGLAACGLDVTGVEPIVVVRDEAGAPPPAPSVTTAPGLDAGANADAEAEAGTDRKDCKSTADCGGAACCSFVGYATCLATCPRVATRLCDRDAKNECGFEERCEELDSKSKTGYCASDDHEH
jgi:hypothetical protein